MEKIDFKKLAIEAAKIADDKKAENIVILDIQNLTAMANFFVIAAADSTPQINAIASEIEKTFKEQGIPVVRREGVSSASWRVIDYGGIVIHVMSAHTRESYNLEKLWENAKILKEDTPQILKAIAENMAPPKK